MSSPASGDELADDLSVDIRQAEISSRMSVGQLLMVEAKKMQAGGLEVMHVDPVFDRPEAEVVGRSMDISPSDAAAGHPRGVAPVVVVTPVDFACVGAFLG